MSAPTRSAPLRRTRVPRIAVAAGVLVLAACVPAIASSFYMEIALNVLVFWLLAMSLDVLAGYTGLVSLGQAAFLGVGAYGVAYGTAHGLGAWPAVGVALGVTLVTAAIFGIVAVRVANLTFVIVTLALGQIVWGLAYRWVSVSGGDNGLPVPARPSLGGIDLGGDAAYYYFVLVVVVVCALLLWRLVNSPFGLSLRGIRENESRMRTLGYGVLVHKYTAFVISGFFGGIAGVLFAFLNLYVSPTMMDFGHNGTVILMVVLGGLGTLWGPLLGSIVVVLIEQDVSIHFARWQTLLGVIFALTVLFMPAGIWGALHQWWSRRGRRHEPEPAGRAERAEDPERLMREAGR